jgi:hypothetical protein
MKVWPSRLQTRRRADAGTRPGAPGWLEVRMVDDAPLSPTLSGSELEYCIVRLHLRRVGTPAA